MQNPQEQTAPTKPLRNAEIDAHAMLSAEQRQILKAMRNRRRDITLYDFAQIALQAAATDYTNVDRNSDGNRVTAQRDLQYAALLFVYEALRATDLDIIKQWPEFDEMLRCLETLHTCGLPTEG